MLAFKIMRHTQIIKMHPKIPSMFKGNVRPQWAKALAQNCLHICKIYCGWIHESRVWIYDDRD